MPVRRVIANILHRRRHYITPGGGWMRRPGGACDDAGAGSAKRSAEGAAKDGGGGKIACKGNLPAGPVNANADANDNYPGIGRPLLVLYWKPNQAEVGTEEERDGRGDAMHRGECECGMHAGCEDNAMHHGAAAKSGQKVATKGTFPEHLPGYPI